MTTRNYDNEIDVLMEFSREDFTILPAPDLFSRAIIEDTTEKAALVFVGIGEFGVVEWLPKSQLRIDSDGQLYLSQWLYEKKWE